VLRKGLLVISQRSMTIIKFKKSDMKIADWLMKYQERILTRPVFFEVPPKITFNGL
jgi:hypothetical protein